MESINPTNWNEICHPDDPFTTHEFLKALETSKSVSPETGWQPLHITIIDETQKNNPIAAAMPLYLKNHSYGEYIFDWSWAQACQQVGIPYYPKLCSAVPFTPAAGNRLLFDRVSSTNYQRHLFEGLLVAAEHSQAHSCHILFCSEQEWQTGERHRFIPRLSFQYHWLNPFEDEKDKDFDDWLSLFTRKGRKDIRQERKKAQRSVSKIYWKKGNELNDSHIETIYSFYVDTCSRKWGSPYLSKDFFQYLKGALAHLTWVCFAELNDKIVASSLFFQKGKHLYGRYWGCEEQVKFLHFELCYHQPIELCLRMGWNKFEAGAQGNHKLKRGLLAHPTYSLHYLNYPPLYNGVQQALQDEKEDLLLTLQDINKHAPIKNEHQRNWHQKIIRLNQANQH